MARRNSNGVELPPAAYDPRSYDEKGTLGMKNEDQSRGVAGQPQARRAAGSTASRNELASALQDIANIAWRGYWASVECKRIYEICRDRVRVCAGWE